MLNLNSLLERTLKNDNSVVSDISLDSASIEKIASEVESMISVLESQSDIVDPKATTDSIEPDNSTSNIVLALKSAVTSKQNKQKNDAIKNMLNAQQNMKDADKDDLKNILINSLVTGISNEEVPVEKAAEDKETLKNKLISAIKVVEG